MLVLLPDLANPFFSNILEGISRRLSDSGYSMLIASTKQVQDSGERLVDYLDDARADGMIILDGQLDSDVVASLERAAYHNRVLFACEWIEDAGFSSVRCENKRGTAAAVGHLHSLGHKKIGHITGPNGNVLTNARKDAFIDAVVGLGLDVNPDWIIGGDFTLASGCLAAKKWIAMQNRPSAVVCASDQIAMGFIAELGRHSFAVPRDVSVMGFDDIDIAEQFIPPLTTIRQDRMVIGQTAATMLLECIEGQVPHTGKQQAVVPTTLIVRKSTGAPN